MVPLIRSGKINDVLYGLPVARLRIPELHEFSKVGADLRVMFDSIDQVDALTDFSKRHFAK